MKNFLAVCGLLFSLNLSAQHTSSLSRDQWVDSVFKSLTDDQKIAQLIIVRLSSIDPLTQKVSFYDKEVSDAVLKYNVGGICLFQGGPIMEADEINHYQSISQTP